MTAPPSTAPPAAVRAWQQAESALGDAEAVAAAARTLPPRLAVLLRALDALDAGDPEAVRALADEVADDHPQVTAILRLLLSPASPDLGANTAASNSALPFADLLRMVAAARTGRPAKPSPALQQVAGYRPILLSALHLCADDRTEVYANPLVRVFSPRAEQLQMAARSVQIVGRPRMDRIAAFLKAAPALRLSDARWPGVDAKPPPGDLVDWASRRAPWTDDHDQRVSDALSASEADRRALLGMILRRIHRDLTLGRITGMARPVRAAVSLAQSLPDEADLTTQVAALQLRVDHFDPEAHAPDASLLVAQQAWRDADLSTADRLALSRLFLSEGRDAVDPANLRAALQHLMAHTPDAEEAGERLLQLAARANPQDVHTGLVAAGAPKPRLRHLLALHAAGTGFLEHALKAIPFLTREGAAPAALSQILRTVAGNLARQESPPDISAALDAALMAMSEAQVPPSAWAPLLASEHTREAARAYVTAILQAPPSSTDPADVAGFLLATSLFGHHTQRRDAVRDLGRTLRNLPGTEADTLALKVVAWLFAWNAAVARDLIADALLPISRFLMRNDGEPATQAATQLVRGGLTGPEQSGAISWFLHEGQDALGSAPFRALLLDLLSVPAHALPAFREVVQTFDLQPHRTLSEAAVALQDAVNAHLNAETPA